MNTESEKREKYSHLKNRLEEVRKQLTELLQEEVKLLQEFISLERELFPDEIKRKTSHVLELRRARRHRGA